MKDRVVILGYGSLIWDLDDLAPHVSGPWAMGAGPRFPLEFSRISPKRLMGLVVCVDTECGAPCPSHAIASMRETAAAAREDLARRERSAMEFVGLWDPVNGASEGRAAGLVAEWGEALGLRGAVWTELPPNFEDHAGAPFTLSAGEAWLRGLEGASRDEAVRYIDNAPPATDTPMRRRLAERGWWRDEAARVRRLDAAMSAGR